VEAVASEEAEQPQETNGLVEAVASEEAEQPQETNLCHVGEIWVVLHLATVAPVFVFFPRGGGFGPSLCKGWRRGGRRAGASTEDSGG
jgi:hypothetical protein